MTVLERTRLLIPDMGTPPMFSDEQLEALLETYDDEPRLAAADAIEIMAGDVSREASFTRGGVSVTTVSATSLLERAARLRAQVADEEARRTGGIISGNVERTDFWEGC